MHDDAIRKRIDSDGQIAIATDSYPGLLEELKQRIQESQLRASIFVNRELVLLYWRMILH